MVQLSALKLAEGLPFFRRTLDLSGDAEDGEGRSHSLHYAISLPERSLPEVASYLIDKYSAAGDLLLDPFAGNSAAALEALLLGRRVAACDTNPLSLKIVQAKMYPADITEVTLKLQAVNLRRPVELKSFQEYFAPFYDVDTFRELANLRRFLQQEEQDRVNAFIEFIVLGLLHGHGAGFFSVYTFPQISLSPSEQCALNAKRGQEPDYRAVVPRILRKTASVLRDGVPSAMRRAASESKVVLCDPRDLSHLPAASVDCVLTSPPLPDDHSYAAEMWLRCWFSGLSPKALLDGAWSGQGREEWLEYMNEVLIELARVVKGGRRALLDLGEVRLKDGRETLDELLLSMVEDELGRYWDAEGAIEVKQKHPTLKHCLKPRESSRADRRNVVLVLRRR